MNSDKVSVRVQDKVLTLTNLTKVLYPEVGFTKAQVIDYYTRIAPVLLGHIADRPMTFKRYPDGVDGKFFYQKHVPDHRPDWVRTATVASRHADRDEVTYAIAGDLPTLVWAANLANIEIHTPQWQVGHTPASGPTPRGEPDLLVFDLDPGPPATVVECCRVATLLRPLLIERGITPLAKTSGSKGMQLLARISGMSSADASGLAKTLAEELARREPRLVVARMTKQLRPGKVFIDWSQNNAAKTTVAPYSLRARARPTVSTPVTWDEVEACTDARELTFTSDDVLARVADSGDLLAPLLA